ncbi:hypothetical protein C8R43DRAFT_1060269 [Mycena crocata]|nr:hypothetical protein C8R43DRAFT_1060269 [Mycena crocata]
MGSQTPLSFPRGWRAELSKDWDVLGPFPVHAREQQFLSPSFPINILEPIDFSRTWPSSYVENGRVGWTTATTTANGDLKISFPNIRWSDLRATEGWAALQHHAVLRTNITLFPPPGSDSSPAPRLLVQLIQGSYIAILPASEPSSPPEWHAGNIYAMERTLPRAIELPTSPSMTGPTIYQVFVSGDYEAGPFVHFSCKILPSLQIRLFGDPKTSAPTQTLNLTIDVESPSHSVKLEPTQDVSCDFVDGYAFGDAIGLGVRSLAGWWTVTDAILATQSEGLKVELLRPTKIAPSQTRIVPLRIVQTKQFLKPKLELKITLSSEKDDKPLTLSVALSVSNLPRWSNTTLFAIRGSYFYAQEMPTAFSAFPPLLENIENANPQPPILCLHGAGVDIISESFWIDSLPRQQHSWLVAPSGRTSWGLDWHGPSAKDAWDSVDALVNILGRNPAWHPRRLAASTPVVLMGHSNGGQGAWYLASRFPDRVLGVVPASAYIKSQAYVSLLMSRSAHFIDPAVRAILETSLTPDDNDLFLSNLVDTPVLAVHGGRDENVPVWHSREAVGVLQTWNTDANVTLREDPLQLHWYSDVLNNTQVQAFLDDVLRPSFMLRRPRSDTFTLTVAAPAESGSLHGWKIERLCVPGRLGRLTVHRLSDNQIRIVTSNVDRFSVRADMWDVNSLYVDNSLLDFSPQVDDDVINFENNGRRVWKSSLQKTHTQTSARVQSFLSTTAPFRLVVLDKTSSRDMSLALRIAHDLNAYHRLDAEIISGYEGLRNPLKHNTGNILIIGDTTFPFLAELLAISKVPFRMENNRLTLKETVIHEHGLGILFLHPHPHNNDGQILFLLSTDTLGLERAGRLFPIRTGVTVPDWLITSSAAEHTGAAGVIGAGCVCLCDSRTSITFSFQCMGYGLELERGYVLVVLKTAERE